ncbi:hypothetical protein D9M68_893180 [compost metagenome]
MHGVNRSGLADGAREDDKGDVDAVLLGLLPGVHAGEAGQVVVGQHEVVLPGRQFAPEVVQGVDQGELAVHLAALQRELDQCVVNPGILQVEDAHQALVGVFWHAAIWWMGRTGGQTPGGKAAKCC